MAPTDTKKAKKRHVADDDDAELAQEALAEWLARGLMAPDFTLDKMLRASSAALLMFAGQ